MDLKKLDEFLEICKGEGIPGCAVAVSMDNRTLYSNGIGLAIKDTNTPYDDKTKVFLYSCTKPITVTAVMQCYERGLLDIDDPVYKFIPEYKNITVKKGEDIVPAENTMTIRHLLTMTGGFDYTIGTPAVNELIQRTNFEANLYDFAVAFTKSTLFFEPGTKYQYSICHDILAAVVEVVTGKSYKEYLQENIFTPLGMKDTYFAEHRKIHDETADMYFYNAQTKQFEPRDKMNHFVAGKNYYSGGAGLISTVNDYITFADALASGKAKNGYKLLEKETIDLIRSPQIRYDGASGFSCPAGKEYAYGLGVRTRIDNSLNGSIGEFGWDGAAGCYVLIDPDKKLSVFYSEHIHNWPTLPTKIHTLLRDTVYELIE